jgi:hypothetical protein
MMQTFILLEGKKPKIQDKESNVNVLFRNCEACAFLIVKIDFIIVSEMIGLPLEDGGHCPLSDSHTMHTWVMLAALLHSILQFCNVLP